MSEHGGRKLRDIQIVSLSLDLEPGPYELADIRAEIIRLSGRLPTDDPLRIAIACAPRT